MADLVNLLPAIRLNPFPAPPPPRMPAKSALKENQTRRRSQSGSARPISRALKGISSAVLSLRDGLRDDEREADRKRDERRQILTLRLKNVSSGSQSHKRAKRGLRGPEAAAEGDSGGLTMVW